MKIYKIVLLLLLFSITRIQAQNNLRDMVCIVKPQYPSEVKEFYENYGRTLAREGYIRSGSRLMLMAKGGFGTGVVVEYNNEYCVLTNYHVIEYASSATLEFSFVTGSEMQFAECKIIVKDKDFDLALIKLPDNAKIESAFIVSHSTPNEGMEVWSAGFPGIGNKPSWQLGKGIISNALFKDSTLNNSKLSYVIQHTAQVDAGSSGGPLLISNSEESTGYSIIGINTWKARGREGANFAIPSDLILAFLESSHPTENGNIIQKVTERTHDFIKLGKSGNYKTILPFVSNNYIFSIPETAFMNMLKNASKDAGVDADNALRIGDPFEAFRIIIADAFYRKLQKIEMTDITVHKDSSGVYSEGMIKGKKVKMEWEQESNNWFLINSTFLKAKGNGSNSILTRDWDGIDRTIYVGIGFPLGNSEKNNYSFGYERYYYQYFASFAEFVFGNKIEEKTVLYNNSESFLYWGLTTGVQLQLPLKFSHIYVIPFMKIPVGVNLGLKTSDFHVGVRPGLRFAVKVSKNDKFLYFDAEYRYKYAVYQDEDLNFPLSFSSFGLCLGFAF